MFFRKRKIFHEKFCEFGPLVHSIPIGSRAKPTWQHLLQNFDWVKLTKKEHFRGADSSNPTTLNLTNFGIRRKLRKAWSFYK